MRFAGKVAVVTGSGAGIGKATAEAFALEGAAVVIADVNAEQGERAAQSIRERGGKAHAVQADVSRSADAQRIAAVAVRAFGGIDILFNNAGIQTYGTVVDTDEEIWDRTIGINLKGIYLVSKYCIPEIARRGGGAVINSGSVQGFACQTRVVAYAASKGGVIALTRAMAMDYSPTIRVNSVAPGWVLTPLIQSIFDSYPNPAEQQRIVEQRQVMKRIGRPEDIGHAVAFLASDEASFITGAQLFVDGGLTAQLESW